MTELSSERPFHGHQVKIAHGFYCKIKLNLLKLQQEKFKQNMQKKAHINVEKLKQTH